MSRDDAAFTQDAPERSRDEPQASVWRLRIQDWQRHVRDLQTRTYEGAAAREKREEVYRKAFDLVTPIAEQVLADINSLYLEGTGELQLQTPVSDGAGGLIGWWSLTWPLLRKARNRFTGDPLEPVAVTAIFPLTPTGAMQWTHPHLALLRSGRPDGIAAAWPFQVTSSEDAARQEPILRVLAEGEFHERTYLADLNWRILPFANNSSREGP